MMRREFIHKVSVAGTVPLMAGSVMNTSHAAPMKPEKLEEPLLRFDVANEILRDGMRYRKLGSTGEIVSCIGLGGFHIGIPKEDAEATKIIRTAIDSGINFMDNCWDYHDGLSELRMGKALEGGYRKKVFLMTKIDGRTKTAAATQIDQCLLRLRTDVIDLVQHHEMLRMEDADRVFGEKGAQEAVEAARKAGKIRFVGFTGHKDPVVHLRTLDVAKEHGFRFDTVQMPLNVLDAHFRSFARGVVPVLVQEQIGILGMKPLASGAILESKVATAVECLNYALTLPTSVVITGIETMARLTQAVKVAKEFKPLSVDEVNTLLAKSAKAAAKGEFEKFKTSVRFDGTATHPEWLG